MVTYIKSLTTLVSRSLVAVLFAFEPMVWADSGQQVCIDKAKQAAAECVGFVKNVDLSNTGACSACLTNPNIQYGAACAAKCEGIGASKLNVAVAACEKEVEKCGKDCAKECSKAVTPIVTDVSRAALALGQAGNKSLLTAIASAGDDITWGDAAKALAIGGFVAGGVAMIANTSGGGGGGQQQQQQNNNTQQPSLQPLPTTDPVAQAGCGTKADAHRYSVCNDHYSKNCVATSTDAACQAFFTRYCGSGQASLGSQVEGLEADKTGEGMGQTICQNIVAKQFCAVSGRDACPSCQNINSQGSPACPNQNTSGQGSKDVYANLCIPKLDQTQLAAAQANCPTDPLFMNPSFSQVGTGSPQVGTGTTSLPQIVIATSSSGKFRDVASVESPNVFNISSSTMKDMCLKGKLNCP